MMCLVLYLSTNLELPEVKWQKGSYLSVRREKGIPIGLRDKFSRQLVYAVGAQGCACGFLRDDPDPASQADALRSNRALADYLDSVNAGKSVELFYCWIGDEGKPIEHRDTITTADMRAASFELLENHYLWVSLTDE